MFLSYKKAPNIIYYHKKRFQGCFENVLVFQIKVRILYSSFKILMSGKMRDEAGKDNQYKPLKVSKI